MNISRQWLGLWMLLIVTRPAWTQSQHDTVITFGEAYNFPLRIQSILEERGLHPGFLDGFELSVKASFLGKDKPPKETPVEIAGDPRFWRDPAAPLRYFAYDKGKLTVRDDLWQAKRDSIRIDDKPLYTHDGSERWTDFVVTSRASMRENDVVDLGRFFFQPKRPGWYRLVFEVSRRGRKTDIGDCQVLFECADLKPTLSVNSAKFLHHISYDRFGIPLVTGAFFEKGGDGLNQNDVDETFCNTFIATAAQRMAGRQYDVALPILYDKTVNEPAAIGARRAEKLRGLMQNTLQKLGDGRVNFNLREARPAEWKRFSKTRVSTVSPEQFSQENRTAPLVLDLPAQRTVLSPLQVLSKEQSDEVVLKIEVKPQSFFEECLRRGEIVVKDGTGRTLAEELPRRDLSEILRGKKTVPLNSTAMRDFLRHGRYTAQFHLEIDCPARSAWSDSVSFFIERRLNVMRDEIFALNSYDTTSFVYEFDYERVDSLARLLLQTARDTLSKHPSLPPPDALVLISGHACQLGDLISRFYNLKLSFERALVFRNLLLDALRRHGAHWDFEIRSEEALCMAGPLLEYLPKISTPSKLIAEECSRASNGRDLEGKYEGYLQRIIHEKIRHFVAPRADSMPLPPGVPDSAQISQRIEEIKHVLPGSLATLALRHRNGKTVNVHFVAVGFGAAVPFYRHFDMPEMMRAVFQKMETPTPNSFYGNDLSPAGRQMNRRVEVNLVW